MFTRSRFFNAAAPLMLDRRAKAATAPTPARPMPPAKRGLSNRASKEGMRELGGDDDIMGVVVASAVRKAAASEKTNLGWGAVNHPCRRTGNCGDLSSQASTFDIRGHNHSTYLSIGIQHYR